MFRRTIHPQVKILDAKTGLVEYIASDETVDASNEVVIARGARFDSFQKNAPFVDSHIYDSIEFLLGSVVDFHVEKDEVIETVKWAVDVPENRRAAIGFQMTVAGHLKAVSVGFLPEIIYTRSGAHAAEYNQACITRGYDPAKGPRLFHAQWQQKELSSCIVGMNPNAVARAYKDGILTDADLKIYPAEFAEQVERAISQIKHTTFSIPTPGASRHEPQPQQAMSKPSFLEKFTSMTGDTKRAVENLEFVRRSGNETELERAVRLAFAALAREQRMAYGDPIARVLQDEQQRDLWNAIGKKFGSRGRVLLTDGEKAALSTLIPTTAIQRSLTPGSSDALGSSLLPIPTSMDVFDLILIYGAFRSLGVQTMGSQKTKFAKMTVLPTAVHITPDSQGTTIPTDGTLAGSDVTPQVNSIACLVEASLAVLEDGKTELAYALLYAFVQSLAKALDYAVYVGDGTDDETNGKIKGIFQDTNVASVSAAVGNTLVQSMQRNDFLLAVGAVAAAALQRPCRWWISPAFIPQLMQIKDGPSGQYLLKTPAETQGEWHLVGFPVSWTAVAPSTNAANKQVGAFGAGDSYLVGMRQEFELMSSEAAKFNQALAQLRAIMRARGDMREATGFATVKTAAQ